MINEDSRYLIDNNCTQLLSINNDLNDAIIYNNIKFVITY